MPQQPLRVCPDGVEHELSNELYLTALVLTLCVEAPVIWLGYRSFVQPVWRLVAVFVVANFFTHGLLWSAWDILPDNYLMRVCSTEAAVWLIEAELYVRFYRGDPLKAVLLAAMANGLSLVAGFLGWWAVGPGVEWGQIFSTLGF
jgi:hypothetical protein